MSKARFTLNHDTFALGVDEPVAVEYKLWSELMGRCNVYRDKLLSVEDKGDRYIFYFESPINFFLEIKKI